MRRYPLKQTLALIGLHKHTHTDVRAHFTEFTGWDWMEGAPLKKAKDGKLGKKSLHLPATTTVGVSPPNQSDHKTKTTHNTRGIYIFFVV